MKKVDFVLYRIIQVLSVFILFFSIPLCVVVLPVGIMFMVFGVIMFCLARNRIKRIKPSAKPQVNVTPLNKVDGYKDDINLLLTQELKKRYPNKPLDKIVLSEDEQSEIKQTIVQELKQKIYDNVSISVSVCDSPDTQRATKPSYTRANVLSEDFIVLDFETTGFSADDNYIIQIGAVKYINNEQVDTFETLIKPPVEISKTITKLTGISNDDVVDSPDISDVIGELINFIGDYQLVCHNASFDMAFLQANLVRNNYPSIKNPVADTLTLSRRHIKDVENHKLETLKEYFCIDCKSHNALNDCLVTAKIYSHCKATAGCIK